jgi:streptomycin 6-kinase
MMEGDDINRSQVPVLDDDVHRRLRKRFGPEVDPWFARLPGVLAALADRWRLDWGSLIPRGNMSVVVRCSTTQGRPAVLKVCPDQLRIAAEAAALQKWTTTHMPAVYAVDESVGALLIEAIEPGIPLDETPTYPTVASLADLLRSLHSAAISPSFPPLALRVADLFTSGESDYRRHPRLADRIPPTLYDRGRRLATRLAAQPSTLVPLHGDLTPANIVRGGTGRGLVALDPAPCHGDAAFDPVDLLFWQADDLATITARATELGSAIIVDADRLLDWCVAFAGMIALELAASPNASKERIRAYLELAVQAPR